MSEMDQHEAKTPSAAGHKVLLVTGPSGAGRSTAVNVLEDMGFEAIDNMPLSLLPRLLEGPPIGRPIALGIDVRNRDFSTNALISVIDQMSADANVDVDVMYLDCTADILLRRYSETRRRHPLAPTEAPLSGIEREFDLLGPVRARANVLIDTSDLTPHDLRSEIEHWFGGKPENKLAVSIQSFSYKRGIPRGVDIVQDCRFLNNPHWDPQLRAHDGTDQAVADYVESDSRFGPFFEKVEDLVDFLLPAYVDEGKSHLTIAFGCTGGQHRSVSVAEKLANTLAAKGWQVSKRHRELERRVSDAPSGS